MVGKTYDRMVAIRSMATKTEKKLIDSVIKMEKSDIVYLSITELSARLKVAEATIVRFCKKLGYKGFQDFKLSLSQELGRQDASAVNSVVRRVALQMTDAISETSRNLDYDKCLEIAQLMINAQKIGAFGVGNSAITAMEFSSVLARIGMSVIATSDSHMQAMIAANMMAGDVVVLISVSGSTKDIIDVAEIAKQNGCTTVVITCYDHSPLAKYGDYVLNSTRREAAYEGGSVSTIASISYIVGVLYNAIYEKLGPDAYERTLRAAGAVSNKSM